jgi:outer membrane immunogenic protein
LRADAYLGNNFFWQPVEAMGLPGHVVFDSGANMKIRQHLLASALCVLPFAASAADLPVKAPYTAQPVPFSWTGFYVGGSVGMIRDNTTNTNLAGGGIYLGESLTAAGDGGIFGVNAGYNYQMGAVVLGIETDIAFTSVSFSSSSNFAAGQGTSSSKLTSLGTVRARIGYAFDRTLLYATGGLAYGGLNNQVVLFNNPSGHTSSASGWKTGWTAGGGLEYAVTNNWTVRAEGLYVDLDSTTGNTSPSGCRFGFKNTFVLGRLGVNYKF